MPNKREPTAFTHADVFAKPRSDLRTQMDNSIARHRDRVTNQTTRNRLAFRFTIRDVLWLTVVVAILAAVLAGYAFLQLEAIRVARDSAELKRTRAAQNRQR
jgi:hypothetical protein